MVHFRIQMLGKSPKSGKWRGTLFVEVFLLLSRVEVYSRISFVLLIAKVMPDVLYARLITGGSNDDE